MEKFDKYDIYPEFNKREPPPPANQRLYSILTRVGTPFVSPRGARFLSRNFGDRCTQTLPLSSPAIRSAAIREYMEAHGHPPRESDLRSASRAFHAEAQRLCFDVTGSYRLGSESGNIHLDPAWPSGRHIEITPDGWNARSNRLRTVLPAIAAPLPEVEPLRDTTPDPLAALEPLRHLLRLQNDRAAWLRILVWLLAAFRPPAADDTPRDYPILQITGPAGSGKTSTARILRALVDPSEAPITFTPSNEAAGGRVARDNHVVFIDGVVRLARRPAEILARLSTGLPAKIHGEMLNVSRPIIVTLNEPDAASRLASRVLPIDLPPLLTPLTQDELRSQFETLRPTLAAAILSLLSTALRRLPGLPAPPAARFPEATHWAAAALEAVSEKDLICVTQPQNQFEAAIAALIERSEGKWEGTATALAKALHSNLTPRALSQKLKEIESLALIKSRSKRTRTLILKAPVGSALPGCCQASAWQWWDASIPAIPTPTLPRLLPIRVHSCSFVASLFKSVPYRTHLSLSA